jgi:PKHD-type hydroxylase
MFASIRPRLFEADECDRLVAVARGLPRERAEVERRIDDTRKGWVAWIEPEASLRWAFDRVESFARSAAERGGIAVSELSTPLQVAIYEAGSTFDWHIDTGTDENRGRKMTVSVQLSASGDYDGGDLELVGHDTGLYSRLRGSAVAFASILGHRVSPITRGARIALVGWMEGPPYT